MLSAVLNAASLEANLGLVAWPFSKGKIMNGWMLVCVPNVGDVAGATLDPRNIIGLKKHAINFISYDTETEKLTVRLSIATFNASRHVSGASVGKPPAHRPPGAVPGRPAWKYSLVTRDWVPWSTAAPTVAALRAKYPEYGEWVHW